MNTGVFTGRLPSRCLSPEMVPLSLKFQFPPAFLFVPNWIWKEFAAHTPEPLNMLKNYEKGISIGIIENEMITRLAVTRCLRAEKFYISQSSAIEDFIGEKTDVMIISTSVAEPALLADFVKKHFDGKLPLLIFTSWSRQEKHDAVDYPNYLFIGKPFVCSQIVNCVRNFVSRKNSYVFSAKTDF